MAHKKAGGSSRNGRDTAGRRLGVKHFGGESVIAGNIIIRQRGTKWHPGTGVGIGRDHTIFAVIDGTVSVPRQQGRQAGRVGRQSAGAGRIIRRLHTPPAHQTGGDFKGLRGDGKPSPLFVLELPHDPRSQPNGFC